MEVIRGSLEDISRPASSEQTGSRVSSVSVHHGDRVRPTSAFSLLVLTNDTVDTQVTSSSKETTSPSSARAPDQAQWGLDDPDEEEEDPKLQRAIEEMRQLDEELAAKICREKEAKRQRKELQAKLWQELLQSQPEGHCECAHEALNTRLFLALEAAPGTEEEEDFVPVFETQVPDFQLTSHGHHTEQSEERAESVFDVGHKETGVQRFEGTHCGASKDQKKQKDFVKRNIELVSGEGGQVLLTPMEKARLAELLREVDEEEEEEEKEDGARGSKEDMWAVSVRTGHGYTPEPSDLEQLKDIDSKMRLLLSMEEFLSVQSSSMNLNMSQGDGSEVGWECTGDLEPGEKVLQDIKERRGQERRLREIQQQLEILDRVQEMTDESPDLTEEQLLGLLDECELMGSWSQDPNTNDTVKP